MMRYFSYKKLNFYQFLLVILILAVAGYLQLSLHIEPCPLCMIQRLIFGILGILFLIGASHHPRLKAGRIFSSVQLIIAILGALVAGRQVWLQHLPPDQAPPCIPGFFYLVQNVPLWDVLKTILHGSADCAQVTWRFWALSISEWSLLMFVIFMILSLIQVWRKK
ncbi:MAG: disulfide bond formation protein B [Gammaproteobacteria bacterium]